MSKQVLRLPPQRPSTPGGAATGPRWWATRRAAGAAVVTFALLGGCGGSPAAENTSSAPPVTATPTERTAADDAFAEFPMTFAAGDSATWSTSLLIDKKGRFSGSFRSLDTTPAGAEYPNGTETVCAFEGRFTEVEQVD
ncbi:MAG: hypothetical protein FWE61_06400, partial [Micrococcales bacterium]|nr:hypothetical protein [Micrococcales bacterium]